MVRYVRPKRGRPRKLTPELLRAWEELLPACQYIDSVARLLEIHYTTWGKWLERGRNAAELMLREDTDLCIESEEIYVDFFYAHRRAMAKGEIEDMVRIRQIGTAGAYQALIWRLETRFPDRYGPQKRELKLVEKELAELRAKTEAFKGRELELADLQGVVSLLVSLVLIFAMPHASRSIVVSLSRSVCHWITSGNAGTVAEKRRSNIASNRFCVGDDLVLSTAAVQDGTPGPVPAKRMFSDN